MEANSKDIEWLLENAKQTLIAEKTGIAQSKISRLKNGDIKMENLTFEVASNLTTFSKKLQKNS
ncbi:XRE family transcriptional regulator [Streptococcus macedonicus]|uniref:XRE family transcriptional regulator n=1 Tax=Streptococcus macedonicus TaxID=59310 RepID=UPI002243E0FB|nr:XRE family transcriptional regulator [Streptococcus macedonicus]MCW8645214.1 XRE family transcriptional regulator [Streptococcus macedonicus]